MKFGATQGTDVGYNIQAAVDAKNKLIVTYDVINNSADQGQLFNISKKTKDILNVDSIDSLADKGYYYTDDFVSCEKENIRTFVSKPTYANKIGDTVYYGDKFKYIKEEDYYICPDKQKLYCTTKKEGAKQRKYCNYKAVANVRIKPGVQLLMKEEP